MLTAYVSKETLVDNQLDSFLFILDFKFSKSRIKYYRYFFVVGCQRDSGKDFLSVYQFCSKNFVQKEF